MGNFNITSKELEKKFEKVKKNQNSKILGILENLGITYNTLDSIDFGYFRIRVKLKSDLENYVYTDIFYSNFDGCWVCREYWECKEF